MDATVVSHNSSPAVSPARDGYVYPRPSGGSMSTSKAPEGKRARQPRLKLVLPKTKREKRS
jgi:hypothetical protein